MFQVWGQLVDVTQGNLVTVFLSRSLEYTVFLEKSLFISYVTGSHR